MDFKLSTQNVVELDCDVLVVGMLKDESFSSELKKVDKAMSGQVKKIIKREKFKGDIGKSVVIDTFSNIKADRLMVIGMGSKSTQKPSVMRKLGITASAKFKGSARSIAFSIGVPLENDYVRSLIEGAILGAYEFKKYKSNNNNETILGEATIKFDKLKDAQFKNEMEKALAIANAVNFTRDLVNEPPVTLTPSSLASIAEEVARENNLKLTILEKEDMIKKGMNGILAVNKGSSEPPKFIHFIYEPQRKSRKSIAIVGKGITFDSGGLSLKPAESMRTMKMDMAGAGVVMGVMKAISVVKPPYTVHGLISSTENMTGGAAYKVDDVIKALNGKTIEVHNTDAEGRIVLADALSYAVELKVDEIVDLATLTGACIVALGSYTAGLFGNNERLMKKIKKAAETEDEKVWELPMDNELRKDIDSIVADMKNVGNRWGGAITAAMFLEKFVSDTPWTHIDIAGPAFIERGGAYYPKGGTGFGVRTILRYLQDK